MFKNTSSLKRSIKKVKQQQKIAFLIKVGLYEKVYETAHEQLFPDAEKYRIIEKALAERLYKELHGSED